MLTLIQSLWDKTPNQNSLKFTSIILSNENQQNFISAEVVRQEFSKIADNFHEFFDLEIHKSTENDKSFARRWNMLVASDFSAKLWNQFEDMATLCEAIFLEWISSQFLKS